MIQIKNLREKKPNQPWDVRIDKSSWVELEDDDISIVEYDKWYTEYESWFYRELNTSKVQGDIMYLKEILKKYGKLNLFSKHIYDKCPAVLIKDYLEGIPDIQVILGKLQ